MIIKIEMDEREYIKFKKIAVLSNGMTGKIIEIDGNETNYIIMENSNVVNINTEKVLKPFIPASCPYKSINIQLGSRGKYKTKLLHRLLGLGYIENIDNKPIINHKNGDKLDLELSNLEWSTFSENNKHAFDTGLKNPSYVKSEDCNLATHTKEDAITVCELLQSGKSPKQIMSVNSSFGYDFIMKIRRRVTWKDVSKDYIFPNIGRYSSIFSVDELEKMNIFFECGFSVKETIEKMGWEYNEQIRIQVKYFKSKYEKNHREAQVKPL